MAKIRSMTRKQNHDNSSRRKKRFKSCDNSIVATWSDLNHDVLFLVMMQLGVIDFVAFSGVCKSWRSFSLCNRERFMASRPPMLMSISDHFRKKKNCCLEDFEGRKLKTIIPHSAGRKCVGLTCGYLILFGKEKKDFWLVNPITRHQLHFPNFEQHVEKIERIKGILVFSPSINRFLFVLLSDSITDNIWFSIAGKRAWSCVPSFDRVLDLHVFKGKIYAPITGSDICEMRLNPTPELMLLKNKDFGEPEEGFFWRTGENIYMKGRTSPGVKELDFCKRKLVLPEEKPKPKAIGEYAFFCSRSFNYYVAIKPESWADHPQTQYQRHAFFPDTLDTSRKYSFFSSSMWYFPHECVDINQIDD